MIGTCYSQEVDIILLCYNGRCYGHFLFLMADVIAFVWIGRFVLLQYIATILWLMLLPCGRCYHHCCSYSCMFLADVIAMWQVESHFFVRLMLLPSGRWNGHCRVWAPMVWCYFQGADGRVILFQFEFWGVMQNLIPYVRQMVFAYVFI